MIRSQCYPLKQVCCRPTEICLSILWLLHEAIFNVYVILVSMHLTCCVFDTLCVSFSFVFFIYKFLVFTAAVYANKDVYIKAVYFRAMVTISWTLRKNEETRLDAFEMKGLRKILRVSWTAKKTKLE